MFSSRLWRVVAGAAALALTLILAVASRDGSNAPQSVKVKSATTYQLQGEAAEYLHVHGGPQDAVSAATAAFTSSVSTLPTRSIETDRVAAIPTGAFRGTLVPPGFVGTPANSPAAYGGAPLTLLTTYIGRDAAEPTIGVTRDGKAFYAASNFDSPGGVLARTLIYRSTDGNATWQNVGPDIANSTEEVNASLDPMVWVDPQTDRVYTGDLASAGIRFLFSDDDGATWTEGPVLGGDVPVDHQTFITAEPVFPFTPTPVYPNLMYFCSNRVAEVGCSRSLDGGLTFATTANPAYTGVDPAGGVAVCGGLHGHIVSDSAGRLFVPKGHCGDPWVAISADSGTTWTRIKISDHIALPHHEVTMAVDTADNLYAVWQDSRTSANLPYLSYSTDHGLTWSTPRMIAPPGVRETNFPTITAGHSGRIAINVPGTTETGSARRWNEYLIISTDALSADPLFVWTTANDPATNAIRKGPCGPGRCGGMFDFLDIITSPQNGEFWAAASDTCADPCTGQKQVGSGVAIKQTGGPTLWVPTAVTVASFTARASGQSVTLTWRTASETQALGFNVWRFAGGKGVKVNRSLIGAKERATGATYRLVDRSARPGVSYTYRLQVVGMDGKRSWGAKTTLRAAR